MVAVAVLKRIVRLESRSLTITDATPSDFVPANRFDFRQMCQLADKTSGGNRVFLVDTLKRVKKLEAQGLPVNQAEAITSAIIEVLDDSLKNVGHSFVTKTEMQKAEMSHESNLANFKLEIKNSQEHHFSLLQRETEKMQHDIEKMRTDLRYELDKVTAGLRLDQNLERGRMRDELSKHSAETTNLTNKIDREINSLKAKLEAGKYDVIKYCIGTLASITAVSLAVLRMVTFDKK